MAPFHHSRSAQAIEGARLEALWPFVQVFGQRRGAGCAPMPLFPVDGRASGSYDVGSRLSRHGHH